MGGSLLYDEILEVYSKHPEYANINTFIETGTYKGDTIRSMSKYFDKLYTFEIHPGLYIESKQKTIDNGITNINHLLGDSVELLLYTNNTYNLKNTKCFFFLDAHISGADSAYCTKYMVPLIEELKVIAQEYLAPIIICVDDARFFTNGPGNPSDWSHISIGKIKDIFSSRLVDSYLWNDRFWVFIE
jgi:hypothetical protein